MKKQEEEQGEGEEVREVRQVALPTTPANLGRTCLLVGALMRGHLCGVGPGASTWQTRLLVLEEETLRV